MMLTKPGVHVLAWLIILFLALPPGALGQQSSAAPVFKQEELEQILAPIALHPDPRGSSSWFFDEYENSQCITKSSDPFYRDDVREAGQRASGGQGMAL